MPCLLKYPVAVANTIKVFVPESENHPGETWFWSMLYCGREPLDPPGTVSLFTPEQVAALPKTLRVGKPSPKGVPDIIHAHGFVVSRRVRDLLEELEPGRHGFFPIRVISEDGAVDHGEYYILHLHHFPDVIDFDHTLFPTDETDPKEYWMKYGAYGLEVGKKEGFRFKKIGWKIPPPKVTLPPSCPRS